MRDPRGHSFGHQEPAPAALDLARWQQSDEYLFGIDLFNHGYYWEAHECWESLWIACGRSGTTADFLKALIKLAAAGVKVREGRSEGVRRHARRAIELFHAVKVHHREPRVGGFDLERLLAIAESVASHPPAKPEGQSPVEVVFGFLLEPQL
jgi:predicted metal-dependent hydrolase